MEVTANQLAHLKETMDRRLVRQRLVLEKAATQLMEKAPSTLEEVVPQTVMAPVLVNQLMVATMSHLVVQNPEVIAR
jgi:hypothetical protein